MTIIEDYTSDYIRCVSIYVPEDVDAKYVSDKLKSSIDETQDEVLRDILESIKHIVKVYKRDDISVIIFMSENVLCILSECPVDSFAFSIDNKFYIKPDNICEANGADANGDDKN